MHSSSQLYDIFFGCYKSSNIDSLSSYCQNQLISEYLEGMGEELTLLEDCRRRSQVEIAGRQISYL